MIDLTTIEGCEERENNLYTALDIIAEFEEGDHIRLKQAIRKELETVNAVADILAK
jgi:hypothetical protein